MLQTLVLGDLRQLWRFVRLPQPEPEPQPEWAPQLPNPAVKAEAPGVQPSAAPLATEQGKETVSNHITAETVATIESVDYITTTRTTTTTVITTVTEVVRTPKAHIPR